MNIFVVLCRQLIFSGNSSLNKPMCQQLIFMIRDRTQSTLFIMDILHVGIRRYYNVIDSVTLMSTTCERVSPLNYFCSVKSGKTKFQRNRHGFFVAECVRYGEWQWQGLIGWIDLGLFLVGILSGILFNFLVGLMSLWKTLKFLMQTREFLKREGVSVEEFLQRKVTRRRIELQCALND